MSDPEPLFPLFLKLSGRRVLVVGAGPVAAGKLSALRAAGAMAGLCRRAGPAALIPTPHVTPGYFMYPP